MAENESNVHELDLDAVIQFETEHAAEIAAEGDKAFELTGGTAEETAVVSGPQISESSAVERAAPAVAAVAIPAAPVTAAVAVEPAKKEEGGRESILQKIAKLKVGERVKLAMLGNKEERSVLIRDGSKVVSSAVLASPKLTDAEVENIAGMKNVQQSVLRDIQRSRKFMKNYNVLKNLINNPRCPLDLSLTMVKNLQTNDLKALSMNKNIPETLKKVALKNFNEKKGPGK
jgi:hypothetical protein